MSIHVDDVVPNQRQLDHDESKDDREEVQYAVNFEKKVETTRKKYLVDEIY